MSEVTTTRDRGGCSDGTPTQIILSWGKHRLAVAVESAHISLRHCSFTESTDVKSTILDKGSPAVLPTNDTDVIHVFGTDFTELVSDIKTVVTDPDRDCEAVIVDGFSDIGTTHREVRDRLIQLRDILAPHGTKISIIEADPNGSDIHTADPATDEFDWVLRTLALTDQSALSRSRTATREDIKRWAGESYTGGRPPLGFKTVDGCLVPDEPFYSEVCATLEEVVERLRDPDDEAGMSKRKAAAHLDTSARTITRAIEERAGLYGLPQ